MTVLLGKQISRAQAQFVVHRRSSVTALLPVSDEGCDENNKKYIRTYGIGDPPRYSQRQE